MALTRLCSECNAAWPDDNQYGTCPRCHVKTRTAVHAHPMNRAEAKSVLNHLAFQRHYRQLEDKRARLGQPTPEEIGKREAFELIKAWHKVRLKLGEP